MKTEASVWAGIVYWATVVFCTQAYGNDVAPFWVLLHEPAVVRELKLASDQQRDYQSLLDELDLQFFPLRNQPVEVGQAGLAGLIAEARRNLRPVLTPRQLQRLTQIHYWRLGADSLLEDDVARKLRLTSTQRPRIKELLDETKKALAALEQQARDGKPRAPLEKKHAEVQLSGQKKVLSVMTPEQQAAFKELLGEPFDLQQLGRPAYKAPELIDSGQWINASSLSLAEQRGKVVVVHFYACGCINCIHNYPSYREWHERFRGKEFVMLGIQTPETESERRFDHVAQKAAEEKLSFPILFDGASKNWNAWGNSMWPSVYVIDKRGYLRHFWPGELKWQGNDGEKFLRERIEALLEEPAP